MIGKGQTRGNSAVQELGAKPTAQPSAATTSSPALALSLHKPPVTPSQPSAPTLTHIISTQKTDVISARLYIRSKDTALDRPTDLHDIRISDLHSHASTPAFVNPAVVIWRQAACARKIREPIATCLRPKTTTSAPFISRGLVSARLAKRP